MAGRAGREPMGARHSGQALAVYEPEQPDPTAPPFSPRPRSSLVQRSDAMGLGEIRTLGYSQR